MVLCTQKSRLKLIKHSNFCSRTNQNQAHPVTNPLGSQTKSHHCTANCHHVNRSHRYQRSWCRSFSSSFIRRRSLESPSDSIGTILPSTHKFLQTLRSLSRSLASFTAVDWRRAAYRNATYCHATLSRLESRS